ncbi:arabinose ABC transporter permease [Cupriavidus sp. USMAHM13]|uniref:MFS transporter n=1 Tax=Cupriavidus sp. USMAHM13 TaxID=1389192 RepID=UPI0008A6CF40|nr:MFS transporter [Cupriavidus sp. USMAHM13]AOZ03597.1 arabinose ABC transporter permease [Cupriavidus sp. USMAHM13]
MSSHLNTPPAPGRPLFFIALGLFGLYTVEFGVVGILPAIMARYGVTVAQAGALVGVFAALVAVLGPAMVLWLSRFDRRRVLAGALLAFSLCSALSAWAPDLGSLMALRVPAALLHPVFFAVAFAAAISLYPPARAAHATAMAFVGTSMGLVLGVPLTTWVAARFSYEASFLCCAVVNLVAAAGIWRALPSAAPAPPSPSSPSSPSPQAAPAARAPAPLRILRKPGLWLASATTVSLFAAMFSVYSYAAEYLARATGLGGEAIGMLLLVFGAGGVLGNLVAGRWLERRRNLTVLLHPVLLALAYAALHGFGSPHAAIMVPLCLLWGAAHTSGLVVSQTWMAAAAPEAPEFATSLFISAANLGVVLGAAAGGRMIAAAGMDGAIWSGWLFAACALASVVLGLGAYRRRQQPAADATDGRHPA